MTENEAEKQKSLALAELMGWKVKMGSLSSEGHPLIECDSYNFIYHSYLSPYKHTAYSMAQFATILLKALKEDGLLNPQKSILDSMLKDGGEWKGEWNED